jgi:hypothetical protein
MVNIRVKFLTKKLAKTRIKMSRARGYEKRMLKDSVKCMRIKLKELKNKKPMKIKWLRNFLSFGSYDKAEKKRAQIRERDEAFYKRFK